MLSFTASALGFKTSVGKQFSCFSGTAECTLNKALGAGGFGETWDVSATFSRRTNTTSLQGRERVLRQELAEDDGLPLRVAAKFAHPQENALENALAEASAWARLPPHPCIVDLLHVDLLEETKYVLEGEKYVRSTKHTLVLYSELLDGASDLEKALNSGSLVRDAARRRLGEFASESEYDAAVKRRDSMVSWVPGGISPSELAAAWQASRDSKCEPDQLTWMESFFGIGEPARAASCAESLAVIEAARAGAPRACIPSDAECVALDDKIDKYRSALAGARSVDREIIDNVSWQIAQGVAHAHAFGLTHFDISPDNIIVGSGLDVRLTDFGTSTVGNKLTGLAGWQATKFIMAPCEYLGAPFACVAGVKRGEHGAARAPRGLQPLARLLRWSRGVSGVPPCQAVDAYELALTLLHLWTGVGIRQSNWIRTEIVGQDPLGKMVKRCADCGASSADTATCHRMQPAVAKLVRNANKGFPTPSGATADVLRAMLALGWRDREIDVSKLIEAIEAQYGGRAGFANAMQLSSAFRSDLHTASVAQPSEVFLSRALTFLEPLASATQLPPPLRRRLAKEATLAAFHAAAFARSRDGFSRAVRLEAQAHAVYAPAEMMVPRCLLLPLQCTRFMPEVALLIALGLGAFGSLTYRAWRTERAGLTLPAGPTVSLTPPLVATMLLSACFAGDAFSLRTAATAWAGVATLHLLLARSDAPKVAMAAVRTAALCYASGFLLAEASLLGPWTCGLLVALCFKKRGRLVAGLGPHVADDATLEVREGARFSDGCLCDFVGFFLFFIAVATGVFVWYTGREELLMETRALINLVVAIVPSDLGFVAAALACGCACCVKRRTVTVVVGRRTEKDGSGPLVPPARSPAAAPTSASASAAPASVPAAAPASAPAAAATARAARPATSPARVRAPSPGNAAARTTAKGGLQRRAAPAVRYCRAT